MNLINIYNSNVSHELISNVNCNLKKHFEKHGLIHWQAIKFSKCALIRQLLHVTDCFKKQNLSDRLINYFLVDTIKRLGSKITIARITKPM